MRYVTKDYLDMMRGIVYPDDVAVEHLTVHRYLESRKRANVRIAVLAA